MRTFVTVSHCIWSCTPVLSKNNWWLDEKKIRSSS